MLPKRRQLIVEDNARKTTQIRKLRTEKAFLRTKLAVYESESLVRNLLNLIKVKLK